MIRDSIVFKQQLETALKLLKRQGLEFEVDYLSPLCASLTRTGDPDHSVTFTAAQFTQHQVIAGAELIARAFHYF